jgi:hypothetical protein
MYCLTLLDFDVVMLLMHRQLCLDIAAGGFSQDVMDDKTNWP